MVSIIGSDCSLDIQSFWFGWTSAGNGSYNFNTNDFKPSFASGFSETPTQFVITLLLPSPKCAKWVKYFELSNTLLSNCVLNASTILFTATDLGISKSPLSNTTVKDSVLPSTAFLLFALTGVRLNGILITSKSSVPSKSR